MTGQDQVTIHLFGSPDDAGGSITKFHEALAVVTRDLGDAGIMYSQRRMNSDGIGVSGYALGLLTIPLVQFAGPAASNVLVAWITSKRGRKLKLKVGDIEVEGKRLPKAPFSC